MVTTSHATGLEKTIFNYPVSWDNTVYMVHFAVVALTWTLLYEFDISPMSIYNAKNRVYNHSNGVSNISKSLLKVSGEKIWKLHIRLALF